MICHMPGYWGKCVEKLMTGPGLGILVIETDNVHQASRQCFSNKEVTCEFVSAVALIHVLS